MNPISRVSTEPSTVHTGGPSDDRLPNRTVRALIAGAMVLGVAILADHLLLGVGQWPVAEGGAYLPALVVAVVCAVTAIVAGFWSASPLVGIAWGLIATLVLVADFSLHVGIILRGAGTAELEFKRYGLFAEVFGDVFDVPPGLFREIGSPVSGAIGFTLLALLVGGALAALPSVVKALSRRSRGDQPDSGGD